jgi:hypothetical protein
MKLYGDNIQSIILGSKGFTKMSFLLNPYILAATGDTGYSAPSITTDLVLHFQASANGQFTDAGVTLCVDGDSIRQINDFKSSNHLDQSTGASQLVYKDDDAQTAGGAYWQASGSDFMDLTSSVFVDQSVGFTTFFVVQKSASNQRAVPLGGDVTLSSVGNWWSDSYVYCGAAGTYPRVGAAYNSNWNVIAVTYGLNANEIRVHQNSGYNGAQTASAFSDFNLTAAFNFGISGDRHSVNNNKFCEILYYDAPMSDANVVTISNELKTRHGIT